MERVYTLSGFNYGLQNIIPRDKLYNSFFYPNICHVCKSLDSNVLIPCNRCNMISYCTEIHRLQDLLQHKDFCQTMVKALKQSGNQGTDDVFLTKPLESKFSLINFVRKELSRNLRTYEVQMIMFAKTCLICNRRDNLLICQTCHVSNFCVNHQKEFMNVHDDTCSTLQLCLHLDLQILVKDWHFSYAIPGIESFPNINTPVVNIDDFIVRYMKQGSYNDNYVFDDYLYSDFVSGPLTVQYVLKEIYALPKDTDDVYNIHIINADCLDRVFIAPWELLLHLFSQIKVLTIIIITPQVELINLRYTVCTSCQQKNKILDFDGFPMSYETYVDSDVYKKPNIIVGYQANFDRIQDWLDILNAVRCQTCPFFLTVKSFSKAETVSNSIKRFLRFSLSNVSIARIFENRFRSIRPHRDVLHGTFYRNRYVVSFQSLHPIKLPQERVGTNSVNCRL